MQLYLNHITCFDRLSSSASSWSHAQPNLIGELHYCTLPAEPQLQPQHRPQFVFENVISFNMPSALIALRKDSYRLS